MNATKLLILQLVAYTRVDFTETLQVPADITQDELRQLVEQRYDEVDGGDYVPNAVYWERGDAAWIEPDPEMHSAPHIVTRDASGELDVKLAPPETQLMKLCRTAAICFFPKEDEAGTRWGWRGPHDHRSESSFDTEAEAAEDAIGFHFPKEDWAYEIANGDTKLGYDEWLEHRAEALSHDQG